MFHHQQCPGAVGSEDRVGRDEHVTCAVGEVAGRGEQPMLAAARLQPLQIDQPTGEVLRQRLLDREILVGRKEMTSDIAAALDRPSRTRLS